MHSIFHNILYRVSICTEIIFYDRNKGSLHKDSYIKLYKVITQNVWQWGRETFKAYGPPHMLHK